MRRSVLGLALLAAGALSVHGQTGLSTGDRDAERGDIVVAERYVVWAQGALAEGRTDLALAALERAQDFADVSSDASFLLARVREMEGQSAFRVLGDLDRAIRLGRWRMFDEAEARLLQARQLVSLRRFAAALDSLDAHRALAGESAEHTFLRLEALKGSSLSGLDLPRADVPPDLIAAAEPEFRDRAIEAMDRFPRDPRPVRMVLDYAAALTESRQPTAGDLVLVAAAMRRLPFLLDDDPDLAWIAAPFVSDLEEARRMVLAYRAGSFGPRPGAAPNPASIIPALNLGLLDDDDAVDELLARAAESRSLDLALLTAVGGLLRGDEGRDRLARGLHSFSGEIADGSGRAVFEGGVLLAFFHDTDSDGVPDWALGFDTGLPREGALPLAAGGHVTASVVWDRYPFVRSVAVGNETFHFAPGGFLYNPIRFANVGASVSYDGLLVPERNHTSPILTRRMLIMAADIIERPSAEFVGGTERIFLRQGVPVGAEVFAGGALVSVTEFAGGLPTLQRVDLLGSGRLDTVRRFRLAAEGSAPTGGDLVPDYVEMYLEAGSLVPN